MDEEKLPERITVTSKAFGGKSIIRGHRLAVEHVHGMVATEDVLETILEGHPWFEQEEVLACLVYARRLAGHGRSELFFGATAA